MPFILLALLTLATAIAPAPRAVAAAYEAKPADPFFHKYNPRRAPVAEGLALQRGDRLVVIGDSITEQKMYSRIIETYLTVCRPDLEIDTRQLGRGGETVEGFRRRVASDCLPFQPTIATLAYGMNDSKYRPYDDLNGQWFRHHLESVVDELQAAGVRVVVGSPGIALKPAVWIANRSGTLDEHNLHLGTLRDIGIGVAEAKGARFADVFWPMLQASFTARARYGGDPAHPYEFAGRDGIHPDWAGQLVMAYAFLRSLGLDGEVGTITVDLAEQTATASEGHRVDRFDGRTLTLTSERYPYCADGAVDRHDSIRSGMSLVPFNQELNRFRLVVRGRAAGGYMIRWGEQIRLYSPEQLAEGVNLADDFAVNPFSEAFARVDQAVAVKQDYETRQIREFLHGPEGQRDRAGTLARTEAERADLVARIQAARIPVQHTLEIHSW